MPSEVRHMPVYAPSLASMRPKKFRSSISASASPGYEPIACPEYMTWFRNMNYAGAVRGKHGVRLD